MRYIIQKGETLNGIAIKFNLGYDGYRLFELNPHLRERTSNADLIFPGQYVNIEPQKLSKPVKEPEEPTVRINKQKFTNWNAINFNRSIGLACSDFKGSFKSVKKQDGTETDLESFFNINAGDEFTFSAYGSLIQSGILDSISYSWNNAGVDGIIKGRSRNSLIVDCNSRSTQTVYNNQTLIQTARSLCQPYGIKVEGESGDIIKVFKIEKTDTIFSAIEREARKQELLITNNGNGTLLLTKPATKHSNIIIEQGINLISYNYEKNGKDIFTSYDVLSQKNKQNVLATYNEDTNLVKNKTIIAEEALDQGEALKRASWEAKVAKAKSEKVSCVIDGWSVNNIMLDSNLLIKLKTDLLNRDFLIKSVRYSLTSTDGLRASLELVNAGSYN